MKQFKNFCKKTFKFLFSKEVILYLVMGVLTTLVNWGAFAVMKKIFVSDLTIWNIRLDTFVAKIVAIILSIIFAFFTNKIFVFESKSWAPKVFWKELGLFVSARAVTLVIEAVGVPLLEAAGLNQELFGVPAMWANVIVSIAVIVLNYVFSKLFIFTKKDNNENNENIEMNEKN